ncbi:hypothetical protein E4U55_000356 [Claviceps digitariae]|nr:hypothetical protein E4U55_000356 [Claviceps digitariae]
MRIAFLGSILFSITARCQDDAADAQAVCVGDCIKSLAERGLLSNGMNSICAAPKLQKAHFQCLVNSCSAESYGRAVKYSISICSATGANIIPLHPIEVRQPQNHKRGQPDGQVRDPLSMTRSHNLHLPRNVAMDLTCNTGGDGLVTVSLGPSQPSATPLTFEEQDARKPSSRATSISSHEGTSHVVDGAILMGEFQDASTSTSTTTSCDSSTYKAKAESTTSSTLSQTTSCSSEERRIEEMPTSTIPSSVDGQTSSSATSSMSQSRRLTGSSTTWQMSPCQESSSTPTSYSTSSSYMEVMSTRTSRQSVSQTGGCSSSTIASVRALTVASSTRESSYSSSPGQTSSTSTSTSSATISSSSSSPVITSVPGCSSSSRYSYQMSSPTSTTSSWSTSSSASCTDKWTSSSSSSSSSSSLTSTTTTISTMSTEPCSSSSRQSTYSNQLYTGCSSFSYASSSHTTSKTLSTTWSSSTYATRTTSTSDMMASPAAYTLMTPSLPPAYVPELEEYGYGTPPPAYDFSRVAGDVFSSSSSSSRASRTMSSSTPATTSSTWQSRTTSGPAAYGSSTTSATTLTQMTRVASFQVAPDTPREDSVENAEVVKVTLISSIAGEFQTTVVTIQQGGVAAAAAAATEAPYQLALNDASSKGDVSKDGSSFGVGGASANAESDEGAAFSTESPLPAMLVAAGVSSRPSDSVMTILAGSVIALLCWAL